MVRQGWEQRQTGMAAHLASGGTEVVRAAFHIFLAPPARPVSFSSQCSAPATGPGTS